jgi:hypothetical protein
MKIQLHEATLDGEPLAQTGEILTGKDPVQLVQIMKMQTPFTYEMGHREYMEKVLRNINQDEPPLPEDDSEAAKEFLTRLGTHGFISFTGEPPEASSVSNSANATETGEPPEASTKNKEGKGK